MFVLQVPARLPHLLLPLPTRAYWVRQRPSLGKLAKVLDMDCIVLLVGVAVLHRVTVQCVHPKDFKFRTVRYTLSVVKIVEIYMFVFFMYRTYTTSNKESKEDLSSSIFLCYLRWTPPQF